MRFSFIPREVRFNDMLDEASVIVNRAAGKFLEMMTKFDRLGERARDMKEEEVLCDAVVEKIIKSLSISFITPFDREDIQTLAKSLDDIIDDMEETAHRLEVFHIRPTQAMLKLAGYVADCSGHLLSAVKLSRDLNKHEEIFGHLIEVGRLENEADVVYRNADAALFTEGITHHDDLADKIMAHGKQSAAQTPPQDDLADKIMAHAAAPTTPRGGDSPEPRPADILMLIKLREIYSWLEATVDACKRTANVISEIVIKGS